VIRYRDVLTITNKFL